MSYQTINIASAISQIERNELLLPAIQRDFVWKPEKIETFLDSLMRGYPFGTLLFWNTKSRLQYRPFVRSYTAEERHDFEIKGEGARGTMVLDGQQRLQSLYIALRGQHEGKVVHFDVVGSGEVPEDVSQHAYHFTLMKPREARALNEEEAEAYWVSLHEIYDCRRDEDLTQLVRLAVGARGLDPFGKQADRIAGNLRRAYNRFKADEVLSHYVIDKNYGDDLEPTPIEEILEIFVRINSAGEELGKSDLMFSLIQLHWEEASDEIEDLRRRINELGAFHFSKDFILRSALVCVGRGARYSVDKLREPGALADIQTHFERIATAIERTVEFLVEDARIGDRRILGSTNSLIPFIYYVYLRPDQQFGDEGNRQRVKHALYLALMTRIASRFAESRIDGLVRDVFRPTSRRGDHAFPTTAFQEFCGAREGRSRIDDWLLQQNLMLLMNIIENGTVLPQETRRHRPELDHIFPKSRLRGHGIANDRIDHYANLRLVSKRHNIWKSNLDPKPYFEAHPEVAEQYLIDTELLNYAEYERFLAKRRRRIWQRVAAFLGISESDIPTDDVVVPGEESEIVEHTETRLRELIHVVLSGVDERYWNPRIPAQVAVDVKARIADELARQPGADPTDYTDPRKRLDFCDVSDYCRIIDNKLNWPDFEPIFGRRAEIDRHLGAFQRYRNAIMHNRSIDEVARMNGEAAILWLQRAIDARLGTENEVVRPPESVGGDQPSHDDYHRLLTRIPLARGQRQLFQALFQAGPEGLTYDDVITAMGRRDAYDLAGVLGALGRRINGTPGFGEQHVPGTAMILSYEKRGGDWNLCLRPEFRAWLEQLQPEWLPMEPNADTAPDRPKQLTRAESS